MWSSLSGKEAPAAGSLFLGTSTQCMSSCPQGQGRRSALPRTGPFQQLSGPHTVFHPTPWRRGGTPGPGHRAGVQIPICRRPKPGPDASARADRGRCAFTAPPLPLVCIDSFLPANLAPGASGQKRPWRHPGPLGRGQVPGLECAERAPQSPRAGSRFQPAPPPASCPHQCAVGVLAVSLWVGGRRGSPALERFTRVAAGEYGGQGERVHCPGTGTAARGKGASQAGTCPSALGCVS